ncbi:MAG: hypothetical protein PHQ60_06350 [Sideroxydans sp.]|nr:hypothetical protein [Sideroxydans sp.]
MNSIVIEHVSISELPEVWRARLGQPSGNRVTVRIEEESPAASQEANTDKTNPMFGMWRDREEMADVEAYARQLRAPRF